MKGFFRGLYAIDCFPLFLTNRISRKKDNKYYSNQVVVTPRVREEVRRHYGCNKLSGAELEDQGEEGTALTHWEKRLFEVIQSRKKHK